MSEATVRIDLLNAELNEELDSFAKTKSAQKRAYERLAKSKGFVKGEVTNRLRLRILKSIIQLEKKAKNIQKITGEILCENSTESPYF